MFKSCFNISYSFAKSHVHKDMIYLYEYLIKLGNNNFPTVKNHVSFAGETPGIKFRKLITRPRQIFTILEKHVVCLFYTWSLTRYPNSSAPVVLLSPHSGAQLPEATTTNLELVYRSQNWTLCSCIRGGLSETSQRMQFLFLYNKIHR